jgi:hypothetical protein
MHDNHFIDDGDAEAVQAQRVHWARWIDTMRLEAPKLKYRGDVQRGGRDTFSPVFWLHFMGDIEGLPGFFTEFPWMCWALYHPDGPLSQSVFEGVYKNNASLTDLDFKQYVAPDSVVRASNAWSERRQEGRPANPDDLYSAGKIKWFAGGVARALKGGNGVDVASDFTDIAHKTFDYCNEWMASPKSTTYMKYLDSM